MTRFLRKILGALPLALLVALVGMGYSYQSVITPRDIGNRITGLRPDGWLADGARLNVDKLLPYINSATFYFDAWRPPGAGPANLRVELCGDEIARFSVTGGEPVKVRIKKTCRGGVLLMRAENPLPVSPEEPRALAVKVQKIEIGSPLRIPVVRARLLLEGALLLLILFWFWTSAGGPVWLVPALALWAVYCLARSPDLYFQHALPLYAFLCSLGAGFYLAAGRPEFFAAENSSEKIPWKGVALAAAALACGLRLYGIDFGFPENYHPDEVPKVNAVMRMIESRSLNPEYFLHPSLLLYLTYAFDTLFHFLGVPGPTRESLLIAGRMVSVTSGVVSVYLTFLIGRRLFGGATGAGAALLLAVFPLHVTCSRYLKEDSLLVCMLLITFYLALRAVTEEKRSLLYWAGFAGGVAASSKYTGLLAAAFIAGAPFYKARSFVPDRSWVKTAAASLVLFPIGFLAVSPYTLLDAKTFIEDFSYEKRHMERGHASVIDAWSQYWMYYYRRALTAGVSWFVALAAGVMAAAGCVKRSPAAIAASAAVLLFYLPAEWIKAKPAPQPDRYILPCLPFIAILAADFCRRLSNFKPRIVWIGAAAVLLFAPLMRTLELASEIAPDTREKLRSWMVQNLPRGTRVLVDWRVYSPNLPPEHFHVKFIERNEILENLDPVKLRADGSEYLIVSSLFFTRYTLDPNPGVPGRAIVKALFEKLPVAVEISPEYGTYGFHNPSLTLFRLRE